MDRIYSEDWFETFGRPDDAVTEREVAFLLRVLPPAPAAVLDVACGFGRHANALAHRGYRVTGIDREPRVVAAARSEGVDAREHDMRELRALPGTFDAVVCMWASFGWFDDATNANVLAQMAEKTRPGGVLVLDVYDPDWFRAHQGPHPIERGKRRATEHKRVVGSRLFTVLDYGDGKRDEFEWRLYEPAELRQLGAERELVCEIECAGFDPEVAPEGRTARMQLVFRRV